MRAQALIHTISGDTAAGAWPYIIFAVARTRDRNGELFGYGTCVEGDTSTHWFRSQDACFSGGRRTDPASGTR
ncbi:hypothetical protein GCM10023063_21980 [Arthrobacter methylotrophus]|uniref:Uncharacterized protein n=1 Tax=Arthrobacter methylotrophus TaxID=121291 RepID=A0ABV5UVV3_9MICC